MPAEIPTSLDKRCRTVLPNMNSITTWTANPREWKCTGLQSSDLYFPILTKTELGTRLGKFWPQSAVHLRDMDWGSLMRCAFSVEMDGWEEGRDAVSAHAALKSFRLGRTANECKRIQEVGAWILDTGDRDGERRHG